MTPRFAKFLILICILGCRTSPMAVYNVEELTPVDPKPKLVAKAPVAAPAPKVIPAAPTTIATRPVTNPTTIQTPAERTAVLPVSFSQDESPADHLAEASRCIERDDLQSAGAQLAIYLDSKPDSQTIRVQYAEILASLKRRLEARGQFNQFLALAQEQKTEAGATMIHVHRRLMEIAEEANDEYGVHLHRGIGLYLLGQRRAQIDSAEQDMPAEGLLCKAAAELTLAHDERPNEAQVSWYLFQVWSQLGQRHAALARLREARDAAPFSYLSPVESRKLSLACLDCLTERSTR